ncbi:uncharacterized protein ACBT57_024760 [Dama dama]
MLIKGNSLILATRAPAGARAPPGRPAAGNAPASDSLSRPCPKHRPDAGPQRGRRRVWTEAPAARAHPPPAAETSPFSTGRPRVPHLGLATPAHPSPSVLRVGIQCGRRPRRRWAPGARRRGRGPPAAARAGVSPPPPLEEGWRRRLPFLPVSPRALPRPLSPERKTASSLGAAARSSGPDHRQTPPPGAAPPALAASSAPGPRDARLAAPTPPLRRALALLAGPFRGPGTRGQRTVGQPSPDPTGKPKQLGPRRRVEEAERAGRAGKAREICRLSPGVGTRWTRQHQTREERETLVLIERDFMSWSQGQGKTQNST